MAKKQSLPAASAKPSTKVAKAKSVSGAPAAGKPGEAGPPAGPPKNNKYTACFLVTKHSWKGKYKRLLCVSADELVTLNHTTFEQTNVYVYGEDLVDVLPSMKVDQEFNIVTKKGKNSKKSETITFSTASRTELLQALQAFRKRFVGSTGQPEDPVYNAYKQHWSESRKMTNLSAWPTALVQLGSRNEVIAKYNYSEIEALVLVDDYPGAFAVFYGGFGRMHLFALDERDQLLRRISEYANNYVGIQLSVRKKTITLDQFRENRLGRYANDIAITSLSEFRVNKISVRHNNQPVARIFATSEVCVLECDPSTYSVICARPLADVSVLIRWPDDP